MQLSGSNTIRYKNLPKTIYEENDKVRKRVSIRNRYNQIQHQTQVTVPNGNNKMTINITIKSSALSQQVITRQQ